MSIPFSPKMEQLQITSRNGFSNTSDQPSSILSSSHTLRRFGLLSHSRCPQIGLELVLPSFHKRNSRSCARWINPSWLMLTSDGDQTPISPSQNTEELEMSGTQWPRSFQMSGSNSITRWVWLFRLSAFIKLISLMSSPFAKLQVTGVNHKEKTVEVLEKGQTEPTKMSYDVLLNTSPIDQLVNNTQITAPLDIVHNKVSLLNEKYFWHCKKWEEKVQDTIVKQGNIQSKLLKTAISGIHRRSRTPQTNDFVPREIHLALLPRP